MKLNTRPGARRVDTAPSIPLVVELAVILLSAICLLAAVASF